MTIIAARLTVNGQTYNIPVDSGTGEYSIEITAPAQPSGMNSSGQGPGVGENAKGIGYYPVVVELEDEAGNITTIDETNSELGNYLKLKVYEAVKPVTAFTYPTTGAKVLTNNPTITLTLTDSGSGIKPDSVRMIIDGGAEISLTAVKETDTTYKITYTPPAALTDGSHIITAYCLDYDGNRSDNASTSFVIDTVDPSLSLTSPENDVWLKSFAFTVSGITNDATSSPVTISMILNGADQGVVVVDADTGNFSKSLTGREGSNTLDVTATDSAGRTTTVSRTFNIDTKPPVLTELIRDPSDPVLVGTKFSIRLKATD